MGDETQSTLHNLFTAPDPVQEGEGMSDLELLADTMEEWSTTSGDHHMLAAAAIRQLIKLQASLQNSESEPTEEIDPVAEMWKTDIY